MVTTKEVTTREQSADVSSTETPPPTEGAETLQLANERVAPMSPPAADDRSLGGLQVKGLVEEIAAILRNAIWRGALVTGERLNEPRLSREFHVSRAPIREALRLLEKDGLVHSIPRRGSFVRRLSAHDIDEIYQAECAIEAAAAELAMQSASSDDLDQLDAILDDAEHQGDGLRGRIERDLDFHRALVLLSGNSRMAAFWDQLAGQIRLALTLVDPFFYDVKFFETTHRPLVQAIRDRDVSEARRLISTLMTVGRSLKERWAERT